MNTKTQTMHGMEVPGHAARYEAYQHPRLHEGVFVSHEETAPPMPTSLFHGTVQVGRNPIEWTLEVPEQPSYPGIATFVPGYLGIKQSSRKPRNALAQEGIATVTYSPGRNDSLEYWLKGLSDPQLLHENTLKELAVNLRQRKPEIERTIPEVRQLDFDRKLLVLHSMGGLAGPRYALHESTAVDAIIGYATVGFGHPTVPELMADIPKKAAAAIRHELIPGFTSGAIELSMRNLRDITRYYMRLRVLFEGLSCLRDRTITEVDRLRDRGIAYHYLGFENDILVRPGDDIGQYVSSWHVMEKYGHLAPQVKAAKVARQAGELVLRAA